MLEYRREIDGLRAIAVLSVIFFHAGFQFFKGGYVGVDIFFVISGFLITTIILTELENNRFSIVNFYERRARRILPALFFVMAVTIPFAWFILPPKDLESFFGSLNAITTFRANYFFWKDTDYFATAAELKPLLHTWSLAVEEQYYIIFPILMMLLGKKESGKRRNLILFILITLATISLIRAQILSSTRISENFFLLPTRFWELSIGSFIAFLPPHFFKIPTIKKQWLSGIGIALILCSIVIFTKDTPFPSLYALIPTLGTALVIMYASKDTYVGQFLGNKILVGIGLVSYSAYLWHQPLFAFSRYKIAPEYLNTYTMLLLSFLSIMLAWGSWKFIEAPFRSKNQFKRPLIFKLSASGSVAFILVGMYFSNIFHNYGMESLTAKSLVENEVVFAQGISDYRVFVKERINAETENPDVIIVGSSRVMQVRSYGTQKYLGFGVPGASVEDLIAITRLSDKKFTPDAIILGADPWLFNAKSGQNRWKSLASEYFEATGRENIETTPLEDVRWDRNAIRKLYDSATYALVAAENEKTEINPKVRRDGSRIYETARVSATKKEIEARFNSLLNYAMKEYAFSEEAKQEFQTLVREQSKKRKVVLLLTPYHPKLYAKMKDKKPIFLQVEKEYRKLAKENGISIIGSYNPDVVGCKTEEFYDGMHPKEACIKKVLAKAPWI